MRRCRFGVRLVTIRQLDRNPNFAAFAAVSSVAYPSNQSPQVTCLAALTHKQVCSWQPSSVQRSLKSPTMTAVATMKNPNASRALDLDGRATGRAQSNKKNALKVRKGNRIGSSLSQARRAREIRA